MNEIIKAIRVTLVLWGLVAVLYPLLILVVGQGIFPVQANGSLLKNAEGEVVGSALIGQPFTSDRYFYSRPSTIQYSSANAPTDTAGILKTGISGASNFAASNPALLERIQSLSPQPTADLLYTSGSGLDPHISPESATAQIDRIAQIRGLSVAQLEALIAQNTDHRFLGLFGEPGVNVLKLNLALDLALENVSR